MCITIMITVVESGGFSSYTLIKLLVYVHRVQGSIFKISFKSSL